MSEQSLTAAVAGPDTESAFESFQEYASGRGAPFRPTDGGADGSL